MEPASSDNRPLPDVGNAEGHSPNADAGSGGAPHPDDDNSAVEQRPVSEDTVGPKPSAQRVDGNDVADESPQDRDSSAPRPVKPPQVRTTEEFFRYAYEQGGSKRLVLTSSSVDDMIRSLDDDVPEPDPMLALVAELSDSDSTLAVPVRILLAAEQSYKSHRLTVRILHYVCVALRRHPALRRGEVRRLLDRESDDLDTAMGALQETVLTLPDEELIGGDVKGDPRIKLQQNASLSLLLWFAMTNKVAESSFVDMLDRHVWQRELAESGPRRPRSALAESRTPEVLGWLARDLRRRIEVANRSADAAERAAERARFREAELEQQLEQSQRVNTRLTEEISRLELSMENLSAELADQQRQRVVDKTHHVDDYKILSARVLRALDKHSSLLGDALHALRNQRYPVADEFMGRTIDAIDRERERLRGNGA